MELRVRNVNQAVQEGFWKLKTCGVRESTRNGDVIAIPEPFMTTYERPCERVLFWSERDANPIFHLMESLWMLAGRSDLEFVQYFNSKMANFSDDGRILNGAYGHRWRDRFDMDQLSVIIEHLRAKPDSRRAVLQMWGSQEDLAVIDTSKDVCCNTQAYFSIRDGKLDMLVTNRSNDMVWGAYGANAVHFSILLEFMAHAIGVEVGVYRQFSNNMHLYTDLYDYKRFIESPPSAKDFDRYSKGDVAPFPLCQTPWKQWLQECELFCQNPFAYHPYSDPFFTHVARPMAQITKTRKEKRGTGMEWAALIMASDWRTAAIDWISRRTK